MRDDHPALITVPKPICAETANVTLRQHLNAIREFCGRFNPGGGVHHRRKVETSLPQLLENLTGELADGRCRPRR